MSYNYVKDGKKQCGGSCGLVKDVGEFSLRSDNGRPRSLCKECRQLEGRIENMTPQEIEKQRAKNRKENMTPEQVAKKRKRNRMANLTLEQQERKRSHNRVDNMSPERLEKERARHRIENMTPKEAEKERARKKQTEQEMKQDPERYAQRKAYRRKWANDKYANDIEYRLHCIISKSIFAALQSEGQTKQGRSTLDILPYPLSELKEYIERQFSAPENLTSDGKVWMTWNNWGLYELETYATEPTWHLDHIIPRSDLPYDSFTHPNFFKCWAKENLRPLDAKINVVEGARRARHKKKQK